MENMKTMCVTAVCAATLLLCAGTAGAENEVPPEPRNQPRGGGFEINWHRTAGGGTLSSGGGEWSLAGTVGQHDDTGRNALEGGAWSLTGGFWAPGFQIDSQGMIFRDRFED